MIFPDYDPNNIGEGIELVIMGNQRVLVRVLCGELMKNTKTGEYILLKSKTGFNSSWQTIFVAEDKKVLSKVNFLIYMKQRILLPEQSCFLQILILGKIMF